MVRRLKGIGSILYTRDECLLQIAKVRWFDFFFLLGAKSTSQGIKFDCELASIRELIAGRRGCMPKRWKQLHLAPDGWSYHWSSNIHCCHSFCTVLCSDRTPLVPCGSSLRISRKYAPTSSFLWTCSSIARPPSFNCNYWSNDPKFDFLGSF